MVAAVCRFTASGEKSIEQLHSIGVKHIAKFMDEPVSCSLRCVVDAGGWILLLSTNAQCVQRTQAEWDAWGYHLHAAPSRHLRVKHDDDGGGGDDSPGGSGGGDDSPFSITVRQQHMSTVGREEWLVTNVIAAWVPSETAIIVVSTAQHSRHVSLRCRYCVLMLDACVCAGGHVE